MPGNRTRQAVCSFLSRVLVMFCPPGFPAFAQRVMQIRFVDITKSPLDSAFFLAVTAVDERCASAAQNSKLPFRKRIAASKPARPEHHFPTAIKTCDRIVGRLNGARDGFAKLRCRNFVRIDE